jgi:predicted amidohydrolase
MVGDSNKANPIMAAIQICSSNDKVANLVKITKLVGEAARIGKATFISLPEACCFIGTNAEDTLHNGAETMDGLCVNTMKSLSIEHKIWLQVGGIAILVEQGKESSRESEVKEQQQYYNRALLINPNGEIVSIYDKIHLFNNPLTGMFESKYTKAGTSIDNGMVKRDANGFFCNMAQTICYDMRFPEVYRKIKNEHDCEVCTVPSAFMETTGEAHWEVLLRARAIENQMYIVAAAQCGLHNPANGNSKRCSWGQTMIVSPWGDILTSLPSIKDIKNKVATEDKMEGYCIAPFDREKILNLARAMPVKDHQQPHLY